MVILVYPMANSNCSHNDVNLPVRCLLDEAPHVVTIITKSVMLKFKNKNENCYQLKKITASKLSMNLVSDICW